jgi:hypothetical protein
MCKKGQVLIRPEGSSPDTRVSFGVREGKLYKLNENLLQTSLVHASDNLCELWYNRMGQMHYKALSIMREIVTDLPYFNVK